MRTRSKEPAVGDSVKVRDSGRVGTLAADDGSTAFPLFVTFDELQSRSRPNSGYFEKSEVTKYDSTASASGSCGCLSGCWAALSGRPATRSATRSGSSTGKSAGRSASARTTPTLAATEKSSAKDPGSGVAGVSAPGQAAAVGEGGGGRVSARERAASDHRATVDLDTISEKDSLLGGAKTNSEKGTPLASPADSLKAAKAEIPVSEPVACPRLPEAADEEVAERDKSGRQLH